jgi:hypothetical protein
MLFFIIDGIASIISREVGVFLFSSFYLSSEFDNGILNLSIYDYWSCFDNWIDNYNYKAICSRHVSNG